MDKYRRKFTFETLPIEIKDRPDGRSETQMVPLLGGRIVDVYSGMPVGHVSHMVGKGGGKPRFLAFTFFPIQKGDDDQLPEPEGGWGTRFDKASVAVWNFYNRQQRWPPFFEQLGSEFKVSCRARTHARPCCGCLMFRSAAPSRCRGAGSS